MCRYLFRVRDRLETEDKLLEERRIQEIVGYLCHFFKRELGIFSLEHEAISAQSSGIFG